MTIRTRFAPSPTGYIHLGNVRTALYTYLVARAHQGDFILRIEDTDQARFVEGAEEMILETLNWLGLNWDEGPTLNNPKEESGKFSATKPRLKNEHFYIATIVQKTRQSGNLECRCASKFQKLSDILGRTPLWANCRPAQKLWTISF